MVVAITSRLMEGEYLSARLDDPQTCAQRFTDVFAGSLFRPVGVAPCDRVDNARMLGDGS